MRIRIFTLIFTFTILASGAFAQTSWLDRPLRNWNTSNNVPTAPRATGDSPSISRCRDSVRSPESISDRAVTRAGWFLFGASQIYGEVTLVNGMASVDGMCRPTQYNTFIFVRNRFAGTLSPDTMDSRTDGALVDATLLDTTNISAEFVRYTSRDALCCPSQTSSVSYQISGSRVQAQNVSTSLTCKEQTEEPANANVVSGTVTYRERTALPRNAVLTVKLVDISRQNTSSKVIAEQSIKLNGQQVPISFELKFDEKDISFRNDYTVEAEISGRNRILYKNDVTNRVLTQGNPNKVEITVIPVGGSDQINDGILRGTITYRERVALPNDAEVKVKLVDVSNESDAENTIAEDGFLSNGRQVPLSFELRFNKNEIDLRQKYVVRAEIFTDGKLAFTNDTEYAVLTQGNPLSNIELILVAAKAEVTLITGKELNISKFGTGSFDIEGRSSELLVRIRVRVDKNGKAEVTLSPIGPSITFSGNLIYADDSTLRIAVTSSGDADASGEIEVKYSGRRLNSVSSKDLVLDSQKATISF
jgi:uncharacterized lipoprotein YbaY